MSILHTIAPLSSFWIFIVHFQPYAPTVYNRKLKTDFSWISGYAVSYMQESRVGWMDERWRSQVGVWAKHKEEVSSKMPSEKKHHLQSQFLQDPFHLHGWFLGMPLAISFKLCANASELLTFFVILVGYLPPHPWSWIDYHWGCMPLL